MLLSLLEEISEFIYTFFVFLFLILIFLTPSFRIRVSFIYLLSSCIEILNISYKMSALGEINKIRDNISTARHNAVKALHVVTYGAETQPRLTRKRLREFSGFGLDRNSNEYKEKVKEVKQAIDDSDLVSICNILNLDYKGRTDDLVDRICCFMNDLQVTKDEEEDEGDE